MSITLECRKTKSEMEIGYGNFFFLRAKVAELFDKNVWQQYMKIMEIPYGDDRKQALEKWDTDMDRILQASEMPSGVKDFLFQSDCAGNISRSACMALYERIHNYDNNIAYGWN